MNSDLRIVFAGTPDFAARALSALLKEDFNIVAVYTQPDRPSGRGHKLTPSPVKKLALECHLPVIQPVNFKNETDINVLAGYEADLMVVAAYGIILPQRVLDIPEKGCLNIHASLLPRWRGAAPIQRAIQAGDHETGITIMQMEAGLDTGPMLLKTTTPISRDDTGGSLHDRLAIMGGEAITVALANLDQLKPQVQENSLANYAQKLRKEEGNLDWSRPAEDIHRTLRAFNPWPGCYSHCDGSTVKIQLAELSSNSSDTTPGTILKRSSKGILVTCGTGTLNITRIQLPGAKAMTVADFVNGNQTLLLPGQQLVMESA